MPKLWPRSLFGRNLLLLLMLAAVVQVSSLTVYIEMQRPRVIELGGLVASQVNTLDTVLAGIAPQQRDTIIAQINHKDGLLVHDFPGADEQQIPRAPLAQLFVDTVRAQLKPEISYRWGDDPEAKLWVNVNIAGERSWISLPAARMLFPHRWITNGLLLALCIAPSAAIVALLLHRRVNLPLRQIADAARRLGNGGHPVRLPEYPATELASVSRQFNTMVDSLEAMEANRAVMLAGISHDIRTPLTKLRLYAAIKHKRDDAMLEMCIQEIDGIVGQFLDFGRRGGDEALIAGDLNTLILQLAAEFAHRGTPFVLELAPMPPQLFRPVAMQRLIRNLMDNAVKYAHTGLAVRTSTRDDRIHIEVLDEGPGLPAEKIPMLLRPFVRGEDARSETPGTGLGLAIVERLVKLHGGCFELCARSGRGLCARIVLPMTPLHGEMADRIAEGVAA